jgi:hypothetical protein
MADPGEVLEKDMEDAFMAVDINHSGELTKTVSNAD